MLVSNTRSALQIFEEKMILVKEEICDKLTKKIVSWHLLLKSKFSGGDVHFPGDCVLLVGISQQGRLTSPGVFLGAGLPPSRKVLYWDIYLLRYVPCYIHNMCIYVIKISKILIWVVCVLYSVGWRLSKLFIFLPELRV